MLKLGIVVGSNCGILREMRRKDEKKKDLSGRLQFTKKRKEKSVEVEPSRETVSN